MTPDTKSFSGSYLLFRKDAKKLRRPGTADRARTPRFRHPSFEAAQAEASRLLELHPQSTFVILQEVARVKLKEAAKGDQAFEPDPCPGIITVPQDAFARVVGVAPTEKDHV